MDRRLFPSEPLPESEAPVQGGKGWCLPRHRPVAEQTVAHAHLPTKSESQIKNWISLVRWHYFISSPGLLFFI